MAIMDEPPKPGVFSCYCGFRRFMRVNCLFQHKHAREDRLPGLGGLVLGGYPGLSPQSLGVPYWVASRTGSGLGAHNRWVSRTVFGLCVPRICSLLPLFFASESPPVGASDVESADGSLSGDAGKPRTAEGRPHRHVACGQPAAAIRSRSVAAASIAKPSGVPSLVTTTP